MATEWISPTWRMPNDKNQSKFENYSLNTSGVSEGISVGSMADLFGTASVTYNTSYSIWIKPEFDYNTGGYQTFFGNFTAGDEGVLFYYHPGDDKWRFLVGDGTGYSWIQSSAITSNEELGKGNWQHHCVVFDTVNNNAYYYIDNQQVNTSTGLSKKIATNADFYIGKTWDLTSGVWTGELTQACIFDYALSTNQRNYLYNSGTPQNPMAISGQPPIAYYPLGGSSTGSASTLTVPNESVADATVFDYPSGGADWIDIGNSLSLTSAFTLSSWVKTDNTGASNIFYKNGTVQVAKDTWYDGGAGNRANITLIDSNGLSKNFRSNVAPAGATVTVGTVVDLKDGEWHQIVFSYDGVNQGKLYTDGALTYTYDITDGAWAGNLASNSNNVYLGGTGSLQSWTGEL